jgi:hypothetical protein
MNSPQLKIRHLKGKANGLITKNGYSGKSCESRDFAPERFLKKYPKISGKE